MQENALRYTLLVTQGVYGRQGGATALRFAKAVVDSGHRLQMVFFYQDGVSHANHLVSPASDEESLYQGWCQLSQSSACSLAVCVAAAERRGVVDETVAQQHQLANFNMQAPFRMAGLAELTAAMLDSDRVVQL